MGRVTYFITSAEQHTGTNLNCLYLLMLMKCLLNTVWCNGSKFNYLTIILVSLLYNSSFNNMIYFYFILGQLSICFSSYIVFFLLIFALLKI